MCDMTYIATLLAATCMLLGNTATQIHKGKHVHTDCNNTQQRVQLLASNDLGTPDGQKPRTRRTYLDLGGVGVLDLTDGTLIGHKLCSAQVGQ
jgi:hypothetical protein